MITIDRKQNQHVETSMLTSMLTGIVNLHDVVKPSSVIKQTCTRVLKSSSENSCLLAVLEQSRTSGKASFLSCENIHHEIVAVWEGG